MNGYRWVAVCIVGAAILIFTQFPNAATMQTRVDYASALDRIYVAYRQARAQCPPMAGQAYACVNRAKAVNVKRVAEATEKYAK
jgi:hypothetical protein